MLTAFALLTASVGGQLSPAPAEATARVIFSAEDAPFTPSTSLMAAAGSSASGAAMMIGATIRLADSGGLKLPSNLAMLFSGFALLNFGPNIADALMGDPMFLARRGFLRLGLLLASAALVMLGPIGAIGTFA